MLHKKFNEEYVIFKQKKMIHVKEKVCLRLKFLKTFKALNKNNPRTHSPQQNKKAVLTTGAYFKVSIAFQRQ